MLSRIKTDEERGIAMRSRNISTVDDEDGNDVENNVFSIGRRNKILFHEFAENTTLHGVKYVTNPHHSKPSRAIWMFLFLSMVCVVFFIIFIHINNFLKYATKTVISFNTPKDTEFPVVYICNCDQFSAFDYDSSEWKNLAPLINGVVDIQSSTMRLRKSRAPSISNLTREEMNTVKGANFKKLGLDLVHGLDKSLLDCRWAGNGVTHSCSAANFSKRWTDVGVCYVFNEVGPSVDSGLRVATTGPNSGLWLRLKVNSENAVKNTYGKCFKVAVQPREDSYLIRDIAVTVGAGYHVFLSMNKQIRSSMPYPYDTKCRGDGLSFFANFSTSTCRLECLTKATADICGCVLPFMPESSGFPYCDLLTLYTCEINYNASPNCSCQTPCRETLYNTQISYDSAPSVDLEKDMNNIFNWTREDVSRNIVEVSIYFKEQREQWMSQAAVYTVPDLISSIGGVLGLFLGCSFITVFEFADFLVTRELLRFRWLRNKCKRLRGRDNPV